MKIQIYGDSIMKAVLVDENYKYHQISSQLLDQLQQETGVTATNRAHFGYTAARGQSVLQRDLDKGLDCQIALLEFGGNDCDHNWEEIAAAPNEAHKPKNDLRTFSLKYKELIDEVCRLGSSPIMLSLTPLDPERYFNHFTGSMDKRQKAVIKEWLGGTYETISSWHEMYNLQVFKLAIALKVPIIDITSVFFSKKDYRDYLCEDGIHPNENGHRLIADAICDHLKTIKPARSLFSFSL